MPEVTAFFQFPGEKSGLVSGPLRSPALLRLFTRIPECPLDDSSGIRLLNNYFTARRTIVACIRVPAVPSTSIV